MGWEKQNAVEGEVLGFWMEGVVEELWVLTRVLSNLFHIISIFYVLNYYYYYYSILQLNVCYTIGPFYIFICLFLPQQRTGTKLVYK